MSAYPLQALLTVRYFREEGAKNAVRAAERRLAEAQAEVRRREEELERYRIWRPEEENRRYDAIMGASLSLDDVAEFRASLSALAGMWPRRKRPPPKRRPRCMPHARL